MKGREMKGPLLAGIAFIGLLSIGFRLTALQQTQETERRLLPPFLSSLGQAPSAAAAPGSHVDQQNDQQEQEPHGAASAPADQHEQEQQAGGEQAEDLQQQQKGQPRKNAGQQQQQLPQQQQQHHESLEEEEDDDPSVYDTDASPDYRYFTTIAGRKQEVTSYVREKHMHGDLITINRTAMAALFAAHSEPPVEPGQAPPAWVQTPRGAKRDANHLEIASQRGTERQRQLYGQKPVLVSSDAGVTAQRQFSGLNTAVPVSVVYYANTMINEASVWDLMRCQLQHFNDTGIMRLPNVRFYAVVFGRSEVLQWKAEATVKTLVPEAEFSFHVGKYDQHEYPGIARAWEAAQKQPDGLVLYFHAMSLWDLPFRQKRVRSEITLFDAVVGQWRRNMHVLQQLPSVNKLGASCAGNSTFVWHNYWWARTSYLRAVERPVVVDRRYYYVDWLGRTVSKVGKPSKDKDWTGKERPYRRYQRYFQPDDCFSVLALRKFGFHNVGAGVDPADATFLADKASRRAGRDHCPPPVQQL